MFVRTLRHGLPALAVPARLTIALALTVATVALTASVAFAQWPTTCVELNDIVEAHLGNDGNVGIYQKVFGADAETACQNDHRDDVRSMFGWAFGQPSEPSYGDFMQAESIVGRGWYTVTDDVQPSFVVAFVNQFDVWGDFTASLVGGYFRIGLYFPDTRGFVCIVPRGSEGHVSVIHGGDTHLVHEATVPQYCGESVRFGTRASFEIVDAMYRQQTGLYSFTFRDIRDRYSVGVELGDLNNPAHPLTRALLANGHDLRYRDAWPTTCVELNDIVEAHLGNTQNVAIYQRAFGDGAETGCRNDHRPDVQSVFAWAF